VGFVVAAVHSNSVTASAPVQILVGIVALIAVIVGIVRIRRSRNHPLYPNLAPWERARSDLRLRLQLQGVFACAVGLAFLVLLIVDLAKGLAGAGH
jgi:hypothetical protein